ncbi:PDZ and LIM domain protein Zasp isoform X1 [Drosophila elegans]|uniref:PDZ and LIM domain protein Zasp isoform X1 n=1 Tax=Drosophila elegans TaxID=30023 RepID=UPI0007E60AE3|nr:PDZ and LIM domain protein Zasp isoform X1 [Drosophila elegans]XP_017120005.1 PDZ and LIM domain protein Zasp isoform X1 [Drosophila elegans]
MAQPQLLQVKLSRFDAQPWGFRLQGGTDFAQPLLVQKVNAGSLSEQAGLQPGDAVVKINDVDVFNLRHKDAQDIVVRSGNNFVITVQRGGSTWRPHVTPTGNVPQPNSPYLQTVTKTSLAHKQQDSQHIGCGYNNAARPFSNGGDGGVKSIVNKQYNTPVGIYSDESIAETLSAQAEVLAGGVLGVNFKKNEKEYQGDRSEVLKFLREEETGQSTPAFGNSHYEHDAPQQQQQPQQQQYNQQQHQQQHYHQQHHQQQQQQQLSSTTRHVSAPVNSPKPPSTGGLPTGQNICTECERLITGVFVRIKDKNLHVECFKCATCGTSLKNQGYYNFNNKLYCDIHAKQAAINNPPSGTEGYVPVPIKPNTKLSASTISTALNSHGYGGSNSNGYSNGNSAPAPPESESSQELPLPPPPSPTQLLQYEAEQQQQQQLNPEQHLPSTQQQQQHTRTHSSLSSISSGSSSSGVGGSGSGSGSGSGVGQSQQSYSSTLSLDRFGSPQHSRQTSASSTSLEVAAVVASPAGQADNYTMATPPSPPPPPPPQAQVVTNYRLQAQNENDMNTQNKSSPNAYNQLLKEYSNKLQQQQQHTSNTTQRHNNNTAKPFTGATTTPPQQHLPHLQHQQPQHQQQQQPLVAALTATLANQLKFNPHQVASPQATALQAATPIVATATDSPAATATSDNMSAYVADEPSSIYGQINTNSGAVAPPPQQQQQQPTAGGGDQPFEYVTLTGNVIRSVQAPGKGTGTSYKVNQGYARPFGAAAPKSPVASYPPQQQQQSPRPAPGGNNNFNNNNAYATLPRSNVGQQVPTGVATAAKVTNPHANPQTYATLPRPHPQATDLAAHEMDKEPHQESDATSLLAESVGKIDMGDKTHAFMQEAGKIINNMLEARLANNGGPSAPLSHAGSSLSLRSNSSSNLSKSPMIVRKRLDLDDFKNLDPTQPVALQPVVAVHSQKDLPAEVGNQRAQPQVPRVEQTLQMELPAQHPMGKILDLCDGGKAIDAPEPVAFRNNLRRTGATHAADRRSYIEPKQGPSVAASQNANQNADQNGNGTQNSSPTYSVSVKALGPHSEDQKTMSEENERAVSQLLKEGKRPVCCQCNKEITSGPFITALGRIWCPDHFICVNGNCRRPLQDIGFVEEKGDLYCEYCFEKYLAPTCSKCAGKIKGDCLNAIGKHFHPECFTCGQCGKIFGNRPFFLEDGNAYCEADWNELFTTKCFACGFPVEAGDRWVEALNHNYHSQCFNCTFCKQNLEGQSFYNKGGRPFCKNHAR